MQVNGKPAKKISVSNSSILVEQGDQVTFNIIGPATQKYRFTRVDAQVHACTNSVNAAAQRYVQMGDSVIPTRDVVLIERKSSKRI